MQFSTKTVAAVSVFAGVAASASAQYATVNPAPSSELGHAAILSSIYGGSWSASGVNVTSGASTAMRIMDAGAPGGAGVSLASLATASSQDDIWHGGIGQVVTVEARAKFAGDSHIFGWIDDTQAEPVFQPIISTSAFGSPVTVELSPSFRWALQNVSTGRTFTSLASNNTGTGAYSNATYDQLVSYHVTGPGGLNHLALFWEDRIAGQGADYDYNDAVVTVTVAPSPGTAVLAGVGLVGLVGRRRR